MVNMHRVIIQTHNQGISCLARQATAGFLRLVATVSIAAALFSAGDVMAAETAQRWRFVVFDEFNNDLPDDAVGALTTTSDGALWVGTFSGGLGGFHDDEWTWFNQATGDLPNNTVRALITTSDGALWVGTYGGLERFHDGEWTRFNQAAGDLQNDTVLALTTTSDGALWVGTYGGLGRFHDDEWTWLNHAAGDLQDDPV